MENSNNEVGASTASDNKKSVKKRIVISAAAAAGALAVVYAAGVCYYSTHFFHGTHIGTFDCSGMTAAQAREHIQNDIDNYSFTFFEKDGEQETIKGEEINFKCTPVEELDVLKANQNPFAWPFSRKARHLPLNTEVSYNKDALYNRITQMSFMAKTRENMQHCADKIHYENGTYTVEDDGTKDVVSLVTLYNKVKPKINDLYKGMSLEKEGCYAGLAEDDTMKGVLNMLNKYVGAKITYKNGGSTTVLDNSTINEWITVTDDYLIRIDPEKVKAYVAELAKGYNTVGKERSFKTTGGSEVKVSGGNYGWVVNNVQETEDVLNIIRSGETVEREPVYKQTAAVHGNSDISNTYVEISLGSQHMWYYKNGNLVASSDVVTGNPYRGNSTPAGVYRVAYKAKNVVLKGQDYESPVSFWMPFNGGIGLHDASWRGSFGGRIYRGGGSHGCVNLPYSAASTLYNNVSSGDPVIVY